MEQKEELWFDVEKRYNTTVKEANQLADKLWFDVEKRYNTTNNAPTGAVNSCGLM